MMLRWLSLQMQRRRSSRKLRELTDQQLSDIGLRRDPNGEGLQRARDRLDEH